VDVTARATHLIATGDLAALGALMTEAQTAFDQLGGSACPSQLTAPVLHGACPQGWPRGWSVLNAVAP
jgi:hypothetical protein